MSGEGGQEGLGEYFVKLSGVGGSLELPRSGEGVLGSRGAAGGGEGLVGNGGNLDHDC